MQPGTIAIDGRLLAYRRGGISRYVQCLATALAELWEVSWPERPLPFRLIINRRTIDPPLPPLRVLTPPHHALERWILGLELSLRKLELIHATDFVVPHVRRSIRRVVTIQDLAFLDVPEELTPDSRRYYFQAIPSIREADRILTPSQATAERVVRVVPSARERIRVIPLGVEERWFDRHPEPERLLRGLLPDWEAVVNGSRPLILAVGTVEPRKRYDLLLDAFLELHTGLQRSPLLVVVGQEGWNALLTANRLRALEARGAARWLERADDDILRALYSVATVLVIASRDEGFCLPAVEALACGLPVVAFAVGALPEVVGEAGILLERQTARDLAEAVGELLENASRRAALSALGRERARCFSWQKTAEATFMVYQELLADG